METNQKLLDRVNYILSKANVLLDTKKSGYTTTVVDEATLMGVRVSGLSFIEQVYGKEHSYYINFRSATGSCDFQNAQSAHAILTSIKDEIDNGWLLSFKALVSSEIFSDFMEMAEHLLTLNYKDPAAVMIGGILEEHLRQIAIQNGIEVNVEQKGNLIPKKADRLNADLFKANCYSPIEQKTVTSWLAIRNSAAHGKYDDYTKSQIEIMLFGVRDFIGRTLR
ncbi:MULTISPECIES: hypothetical protein [Vibrio harveyi group]|uniref:hypothetical protein n=1 Tax=Vibrio harveyi group TaxID=717610 RepID=UPI0021D1F5CB|nr:hypothetical protein [Vibrio alginolyticus]ELB2801776.1 hypothetical protein [Vibrio alginolyticus]ELP2675666.1 hypothetical protein [Vibrio parahaemolyticus]MDG2749148.1 hypothetical protein [Vibrio parahaemolyticus]